MTGISDPGVFFSKCRPQGCDAIELVKQHNIAFIGYPIWKKGWEKVSDPQRVATALIHPKACRKRQDEIDAVQISTRKASEHHNLNERVVAGSFILVPRVREGKCYVGKVVNGLELATDLPWLDQYFELRQEQGLSCDDPLGHAADVCQIWRFASPGLVEIPLYEVPGWILYRLMARNTSGQVHEGPGGQSPYEVVQKLYQGESVIDRSPTSNVTSVRRRLEDKMMPPHFEHLCVDLLNLERAGESWWHTGGVADGGADGIAVGDNRVAVLQCKLHLSYDPHDFANAEKESDPNVAEYILASLFHSEPKMPLKPGATFWGAQTIAELVVKHSARLPMAKALGVKT